MTVSGVSNRTTSGTQQSQNLNRGDSGPQVSALQNKLNSLGINVGTADGSFGAKTEAGVKQFQAAHGLTADGVVGPRTQAALDQARAPAASPAPAATPGAAPNANLQQGSTGGHVRTLQTQLQGLGFKTGGVDGQFGGQTANAVKNFQAQWGLSTDGQYGANTRNALNRALAGEQPPHPNAKPSTSQPNVGGTTQVGPGTNAGASALESARSQVGVHEATGNNDGVPSQRYMNGRQEPWCANFVSWNFRQAGTPLPGNQRSLASVQYMEDQMKGAGKFFPRGSQTPQPGDIIFFGDRGANGGSGRHVGMVERVEAGRVYTIEGNSGDAVSRRNYDLNLARITGYGRM